MSSSITIFSMLASLALVFILIDLSLASNLDNVCSKTDDKNLCKVLLKGEPDSSEDIDYGTLCKNAFDGANFRTTEIAKNLALALDLSIDYLIRCYHNYDAALKVLRSMNIKDSDYKHIEDQIRNVTEQVKQCNNELKLKKDLISGYNTFNTFANELKILLEAITSSAKYWKGGDN